MAASSSPIAVTATAPAPASPVPRGLWLWPAVVMIVAYWTFHFTFQAMEVSTFVRFITRMGANALLLFAFLLWWCINRRIPRWHRLAALAVAIAGGVTTSFIIHPSLGIIGVLTTGVAFVTTAWVISLLLLSRASPKLRWSVWAAAVLLVWGSLCLLRMDGLSGEQVAAIHWRWQPSAEELFLAEQQARNRASASPVPPQAAPLEAEAGDWVAFRGIGRDGAAPASEISTDWSSQPPQLVWRNRVGPAWSSLIVVGGRLFTQEQRGEQEAVVCYDASTGQELWSHADGARFYDQVSGAGPRATPTFHNGRILALGGTGILNCLDAATGKLHWSHDLAQEVQAPRPLWGFSCSPLVVGTQAIVFAGGNQKPLLAYDVESGRLNWSLDAGPASYSSPQLATLGGREQVLFLSDLGLFSVDPATGEKLWEFAIPIPGAPISIQPHAVGENQVLVASNKEGGVVLLEVKPSAAGWDVEERWVSRDLKPSFNDFVIHDRHAFGFDGNIFACINLETGKRQWKKGRYGNGQAIALSDQDQLLVLSESGEVLLLAADPDEPRELGRFQAIAGKTWNHPVVAQGRLYARNAQEMACYDLRGADSAARTASSAPVKSGP